MVSDLNSAMISTIDTEFERVQNTEAPSGFRIQEDLAVKKDEADGAVVFVEDAQIAPPSMDDLIPRIDISSQLTDDLVDTMGDSNWKIRKEALDTVQGIIEGANKRIGPNLGKIFTIQIISNGSEKLTHSFFERQFDDWLESKIGRQ